MSEKKEKLKMRVRTFYVQDAEIPLILDFIKYLRGQYRKPIDFFSLKDEVEKKL